MPMPMGGQANHTSYPQMMPPGVQQPGMVPSGAVQYDSRRQQWTQLRL